MSNKEFYLMNIDKEVHSGKKYQLSFQESKFKDIQN